MPARSCDAAHRARRYEVFAPCPIPYLISATIETHKYIAVPVSAKVFRFLMIVMAESTSRYSAGGSGLLS